jgi:hypothetical protein
MDAAKAFVDAAAPCAACLLAGMSFAFCLFLAIFFKKIFRSFILAFGSSSIINYCAKVPKYNSIENVNVFTSVLLEYSYNVFLII